MNYGSVQHDSNLNQCEEHHCRSYWYRWYIVAAFSLYGLTQGAVWNTWAPISVSSLCAYGFTADDVALLTNWGPITFLFSMPFYAWLLDNKGLRVSVVSGMFLTTLCCVIRCLPLQPNILKYFMHAGQFLNGIAGCVVMAAPPLLSNTWFLPHERVLATSIATLLNYMGTGFAYLVGPALVYEPPANLTNKTDCDISDKVRTDIRHDISNLMYLHLGMSAFGFICILAFFPNKPPHPPSLSAATDRLDFKAGVISLCKNKAFVLTSLTIALVLGIYGGWSGVIDVVLSPLGVSQKTAGDLGFAASMSGCVTGLGVGWIADKWPGHTKRIIFILYGISVLAVLYFVIITNNWFHVKGLEFSYVGLWISVIILGIMMNSSPSLGNELVADSAYPTAEGTATSIFVWMINFFSFILLLVLSASSDSSYANYLLLGAVVLASFILLFFIPESNNRLRIDESDDKEELSSSSNEASPLLGEEKMRVNV